MVKKAIGIIVLCISLVIVVPLGAKGPAGKRNGQSLGTLTDQEIGHITYIREEEKLARDVYFTLYGKYETPIFATINESEQRHMDALKNLIDTHGLVDPVPDDDIGEFTNSYFAGLYVTLVKQGEKSYCDALQVGVDIENLDIEDIENALENDVEARDVTRVFNNLLNGSYNHLNAFTSQYETAGCQ